MSFSFNFVLKHVGIPWQVVVRVNIIQTLKWQRGIPPSHSIVVNKTWAEVAVACTTIEGGKSCTVM